MNKLRRLAGLGASVAAFTGLFFAALLTFDQGWRQGVPAGLAGGLGFGLAVVVFEILWAFVARLARSGRRPEHPSFAGERLVQAGEARHLVGIESVRGNLYLTNKALHFRCEACGRVDKWGVALADVERAEVMRVFGFMSSGLRLVTSRGAERFVTDDDRGWSQAIAMARQAVAQPANRVGASQATDR